MKNTGNIALIICLALVVYIITDKALNSSSKKIGVVQMEKLVYDFKGMKEATQKYTLKSAQWDKESDSLQGKLKDLYAQIRLDSLEQNKALLEKDIKTFVIFRQSYMDYVENTKEIAEKEDKEMTLGVVNQVNEYIKAYAIEEGYDVVLCNTQQQSVGHVKDQIDITQEILDYANKKYEGLK